MDDGLEIRYCKNRKCHKELPSGYKHKYCEACRNEQAHKVKSGLKGAGAATLAVLGVVVSIATKGKFNPGNKA